MARPKKEIDAELFERLCNMQCTLEEICAAMNVSYKTLEGWCEKEYGQKAIERKAVIGKISLRRIQWRLAEKSPQMAMFLGKQYLGQKERVETNIKTSGELDTLSQAIKELAENEKEPF